MMNKLVIFDCDGVLVDSEIISNRIDAEALTSFGYPITAEESIRRFTGLNAKVVRKIILKESGIDIPLDYLTSQQPIVMKAFETELSSLVKPVLESINEMKISRCVASSSPRNRVIRCLELTEQFIYFNIVIEDSAAGIEAAISADMCVIGFLGGGHAYHSWYQDKINAYDIPTARNSNELLEALKNLLNDQVGNLK